MPNPLDSFIRRQSADANDVKLTELPNLPRLSELFTQHGLSAALKMFDDQARKFDQAARRALENNQRQINERISAAITTIQAPSTAAAVVTSTPQVPQGPAATPGSGLEDHIAATVVHGTESDVVGETDEQALEKKTIGMVFPRQGKFNAVMTKNSIDYGQTVTIPAGFNMVVGGAFDINGSLVVEGYFINL